MLSYSALTTSRKSTLPSVEMWNTNLNILKDPPKSIYTRRIDKVGDTQQILLQQDDAGSRINEYINVYARNTNPMVGVSYNNYGNTQNRNGRQQASLPYKVEQVRPPLLTQYDLQPLSRLPRDWFYAYTNPEFPNIVQNLQCNELSKSINTNRTPILDIYSNKNKEITNITETGRNKQIKNRTPLEYKYSTKKQSNHQIMNELQHPKDVKSVKRILQHYNIASQKSLKDDNTLWMDSFKQLLTKKKNPNYPETLNKKIVFTPSNTCSHLNIDHKLNEKSGKNKRVRFSTNIAKPIGMKSIDQPFISFPVSNRTNISVDSVKAVPNNIIRYSDFKTNREPLNVSVDTSKSSLYNKNEDRDITNIPTRTPLNISTQTNTSMNISKYEDHPDLPILDTKMPHYDLSTNQSSSGHEFKPEDEKRLNRRIPIYENVDTNKQFSFSQEENYMNRDIALPQTLSKGGFENSGTRIPNPNETDSNRYNYIPITDSKTLLKQNMKKFI